MNLRLRDGIDVRGNLSGEHSIAVAPNVVEAATILLQAQQATTPVAWAAYQKPPCFSTFSAIARQPSVDGSVFGANGHPEAAEMLIQFVD